MTDVVHNTISGSENHEPKGAESASANNVYVANGSGSGAWTAVESLLGSAVTGATLKDVMTYDGSKAVWAAPSSGSVTKVYLTATLTQTGANVGLPIPIAGTVTKLYGRATSSENTLVYFSNNAGTELVSSAISLQYTTAVVSSTPSANNSFSAGQELKITLSGTITYQDPVYVTIEVTPV